ncbi:MAG: alpha/beta fold hydrolase [Chloroflexi bacterium]|nr:alpha/beta fold hydrolase [Chloroflexota bacterium]
MGNVQTGFADVNGAHLYYQIAGEGQTITFVHAGIADHHLWDAQFAALQSNYRVISYDLRGYGQSTSPAMPYSTAEDLHALLTHLGVETTALVACSMGGTAALDFLLTYPQMATALVMVCSTPSGYQPQGAPPPLILQLMDAAKSGDAEKMANVAVLLWGVGERRKPEQVDQQFRDLVYEMSLIGFRNQLAGLPQPSASPSPALDRLKEVNVPTLIIDGAEDHPSTHTAGELMASQIAGARRKLMANVAHLPSLEAPDEFTRLLEPFLDEALSE